MTTLLKSKPQASFFGMIDQVRIDRIWTPFWINHPEGTRALEHLAWLLMQPRSYRPQNCLIIADAAAGKTSIAKQFEKSVNPVHQKGETKRRIPVVYVQAPPDGKSDALYTAILESIGAAYKSTWRALRKQQLVFELFDKLHTRMLIIDEAHHMLAGNVGERSVFMNVLKHLGSTLQIPIVCLGTKELLRAMHTDEQFASRFEPFRIEKWEADENYVRFLVQICRHAKFKYTSTLKKREFVRRIHALSKGLTGETWKLMSRLIEYAETEGVGTLNIDMLDKIKWVTPGERRWVASRDKNRETANGSITQGDAGDLAGGEPKKDRNTQRKSQAQPGKQNHQRPAQSDQPARQSVVL